MVFNPVLFSLFDLFNLNPEIKLIHLFFQLVRHRPAPRFHPAGILKRLNNRVINDFSSLNKLPDAAVSYNRVARLKNPAPDSPHLKDSVGIAPAAHINTQNIAIFRNLKN